LDVPPDHVRLLGDLWTGQLLAGNARLFVAGLPTLGLPAERVCFADEREGFVVNAPADLAGHVSIDSPAEALAYVRLFSSPGVIMCYACPWWVEVVPARSVSRRFLLGREGPLPGLGGGDWPSGWFGILSQADWEATRLSGPRVERTAGGFLVIRPLVQLTAESPRATAASAVRETVTSDGRIGREPGRSVPLPPSAPVVIPPLI